jgi:hypothetical protein
VTGDAPQPGETPRTEGNPWSFDPDAAWWRGDGDRDEAEAMAETAARPRRPRRRTRAASGAEAAPDVPAGGEPAFAPEALDAHAAGAQDAAEAITGPAPDEDKPAAATTPARKGRKSKDETAEPELVVPDDLADLPDGVPEVMVLPEPERDRPTVPLERGRAGNRTARHAAAEQEVKRSRLEHSPFWLSEQERADAGNDWPDVETVRERAVSALDDEPNRGRPPRRRPRTPRNAAPGLFGLIALGLIATFFSWVSAEPFWLAVGHGDTGIATVTRCTGTGVTQRCAGTFAAADDGYQVGQLTLLGVTAADRGPGTTLPARMVNPDSQQAYAGSTGVLLHLRWVLGFLLVLLCGLGIAGLTGSRQLETVRARRGALLMSVAGPVLLLVGFLIVTY